MKPILTLFLFISFFFKSDIAMVSVKINSPASALKKIKLKSISTEGPATKYQTENGNEFSVTVKNGKVVFMENDWQHEATGAKPLFSDFKFGETSLADIKKAFGTIGFNHVQRGSMITSDTGLISFNCYELDSPNNEVLVFVFMFPLAQKAQLTETNVEQKLKLSSIIISDKKYLDEIWGEEKAYDPNYKKIKL